MLGSSGRPQAGAGVGGVDEGSRRSGWGDRGLGWAAGAEAGGWSQDKASFPVSQPHGPGGTQDYTPGLFTKIEKQKRRRNRLVKKSLKSPLSNPRSGPSFTSTDYSTLVAGSSLR